MLKQFPFQKYKMLQSYAELYFVMTDKNGRCSRPNLFLVQVKKMIALSSVPVRYSFFKHFQHSKHSFCLFASNYLYDGIMLSSMFKEKTV